MKKTLAFLTALAVAVLSLSASAQDKQLFNHMALGVTAGVDGFGLEVAMPATPYLQVRAGYSGVPFGISPVVDFGQAKFSNQDADLSHLPVNLRIWGSGVGKLMLDIFPIKDASFRIVAGAFAGTGVLATAIVDLRDVIEPINYRTGMGYHDVMFSTDDKGYGRFDAAVNKVMPYLGVGFGRAVDPEKRVSFQAELGVAYSGGIRVHSYDYSRSLEQPDTYVIETRHLTDDKGTQLDRGWIDKLAAFPVLPMLKLGVFVRLF